MAAKRKRSRGALRTFAIGVAIVASLFLVESRYPSLLALFELQTFDFRLHHARGTRTPRGDVAIISIDDKSISELGRWPWPRTVLADLVESLRSYKVAVIGFDMVFSERDDNDLERDKIIAGLSKAGLPADKLGAALGMSNDDTFARAIKDQGTTFIGYPLQISATNADKVDPGFVAQIRPPPPLSYSLVHSLPGATPALPEALAYLPNLLTINNAARGSAYFNTPTDDDGVFRQVMLVIRFGKRYCEPLILALASAYANRALTSLTLAEYGVAAVRIGPDTLPVDEQGRMFVNFRGPANTFPYFSVSDVISNRVPATALAGKIALVGATALGVGDRWSTPMGANFPGVEIQANAIDNILTGDFIERTSLTMGLERLSVIPMGLAMAAATAWLSALGAAMVAVILCAGYFAFAQYLLIHDGLLLGVLFPISVTFITYAVLAGFLYWTEGREKGYLRRAFQQYLHPDVIEELVRNPDALKLGGERLHLSILFSDIVGFTTRSERTPPEELVALLNAYMTAMIDVIMRNGGTVDKLMGDGSMAFWGAPIEMANPARAAIECGLDMLTELDKIKTVDARFADLNIGIGIATGEAIVGNFGGQGHFDYSAVGDSVNLASRIEGLTRYFKLRLLVNRQTLEEAAEGFVARDIGVVRVKGKTQAVPIVEVAGRRGSATQPQFYEQFGAAMAALSNGSAAAARVKFEELARIKPDDPVVQIYLERLQPSNGAGGIAGRLSRFSFRRRKLPEKSGEADGSQHMLFELDTK